MYKLRITRFVVLLMVCAAGVALVKYSTYILPHKEDCHQEVYNHYTDKPAVEATFVKAFKINDTLAISATILHAANAEAWHMLRQDFQISELTEEEKDQIAKNNDVFETCVMEYCMPDFITDTATHNQNNIYISHINQTITIFHTQTKQEIDAVLDKAFDEWDNEYAN